MHGTILAMALTAVLGVASAATTPVLRTGIDNIQLILDGKPSRSGWWVRTDLNPDVLTTTADEITFVSDLDTLVINGLEEWQSHYFDIITAAGDTSHVRVHRVPSNPYENPDPELLKVAPSGMLSREQAEFDIDALVYTLSQVHPNIFAECRQADFFRAVNEAKASLADSVSPMQLYQATAPVVTMIGDGHTSLSFPYNSVFTEELLRMPVYGDILTDHSFVCTTSLDSIIPRGSKIISINGVTTEDIINSMMLYASGERQHFKIARIDSSFPALMQMLYPADQYTVEYIPRGTKKVLSHTFPATTWSEIKKRCPSTHSGSEHADYSYTIDSIADVAIMDFRQFTDVERMEHFADSMFAELKAKNIDNLIIDIRNNGGGNSMVGDILLRYISPEPFIQMDKALVRITPTTVKLIGEPDVQPLYIFAETDPTGYIQPRTADEGHYTGNVYLLTSNHTFSSAGSFAWTFKECGVGTVIGEETGGMNVCFGDILMYRMPVSQIPASISFKRFWQLRADENDIHGTLPDIEVPAADALATTLQLIRERLSH